MTEKLFSESMSLIHLERRVLGIARFNLPLSLHHAASASRSPPTCILIAPSVIQTSSFHVSPLSWKKTGKQKPSGKQKVMDDLLDEIDDDEEEEVDEAESFKESKASKETELKIFLGQKANKNKKPVKGSTVQLKYEEFMKIVDGEMLWQDLSSQIEGLKNIFLHQLSVRSATSVDELQVQFEGDTYPLKEIATISKKDPKKVIVDASAFPQASVNIMKALRESGMNLNPQQEGLTIYVPIPKVTKEFREKLATGARKKLNESKEELRKVQNKYMKKINDPEVADRVSKDDVRAAGETVKNITDHFMSLADQLLAAKTKEIMGK